MTIVKTTAIVATRLLLAWLVSDLAGCHKKSATGPPPPPGPTVTVTHPLPRNVTDWDSYSGYLSSPRTANVAPRVSGLIEKAPFREGAMVHEGDTLFILDPRPFQADVDNKEAAVAQAQAQADQATVHFQRYDKLKGTMAISQDEYDAAKAAEEAAHASLAQAKAALETAQLNLQWSRVTAPIDGRVGRIEVTVGNLVNGGGVQSTPLTTIVSTDPLYCYVPVPEAAYIKYKTLLELEQHQGQPGARVPCSLDLEGRDPIPGYLDFVGNSIEISTGTIEVRGVLGNPGWLIPGLYAAMRIPQGPPHPALLIPETAIVVEQNQRSLLVVGSGNVVQSRNVKFGRAFGPLRAVLSGLATRDRVVVDGVLRARPGGKVIPHEVPIPPEDLKALEALGPVPVPSNRRPVPAATQLAPATSPAAAPSTEVAR
jgi:RND family efflux transporter MFP subunit